MKHRVIEELNGVIIFVAAVWAIFVFDYFLPPDLAVFGLTPRDSWGLIGIVSMPFLHGSWDHLLGNTVPLIVLLCLLAGSRANTYSVVPQIILLGGMLLWVFGRPNSTHVGASGLVYGLIAFLIVAGFRERRIGALAIAVVVGLMYGTILLRGVLPFTVGPNVSWDGHLTGAIAGAAVAWFAVKPDRKSAGVTV